MVDNYVAPSISGYNSNPPPDDDSQTSANAVSWAKHKNKLADPIKNLVDTINSRVNTAIDKMPINATTSHSANHTLTTDDYGKLLVTSNAITITLLSGSNAGSNFIFYFFNADSSNNLTLGRNGANINGSGADLVIPPGGCGLAACDGTDWRVFDLLRSSSSVTFISTDAGASAGPIITLYRNSASPAASDAIGEVKFDGEDSAGNQQNYALIQGGIVDATSGSEDGNIVFQTAVAGTVASRLVIGAGIYTGGGSDQGANTIQGSSGVYDGANRVFSASNTVPEGGLSAAAVNTTALKTATGSASGSATAAVVMNEYNFFPNIHSTTANASNHYEVWAQNSVSTGEVGRFHLQEVGTDDFTVRWRYITASRPGEIVIARSKTTGEVRIVWKSQIDDPSSPPLTPKDPDLEVIEITDFPDRLLEDDVTATDIMQEIKDGTIRLDVSDEHCENEIIPCGVKVNSKKPGNRQLRKNDHPLIAEAIKRGRVICAGVRLGKFS